MSKKKKERRVAEPLDLAPELLAVLDPDDAPQAATPPGEPLNCCDPRNPDYGKPYEGPWTGTNEALQNLIHYVLTREEKWKPEAERIPPVSVGASGQARLSEEAKRG